MVVTTVCLYYKIYKGWDSNGIQMGEKDIAEKVLLSYNDVFSDIVNVLLFGGKEVILENDLEDQTTRTAYKADKTRERSSAVT